MRTLFENFEGFSQILKEQSGDNSYLDVFTHPIAIILKKWNAPYLKKSGVVDYADTRFSNFAKKKFRETVKIVENLVTLSR